MRAIDSLIFDAGITTSSCIAVDELRMRVNMSAIGSVIDISGPPGGAAGAPRLPTSLRDAGDLAVVGHLPEAQTAESEALVDRARSTAALAARVCLHLELGLTLGLVAQSFLRHLASSFLLVLI